jgi:hypothetical protein
MFTYKHQGKIQTSLHNQTKLNFSNLLTSDLFTPSLVQVQLVQGDIFLEDPRTISRPLTLHWVTSSFQCVGSMSGLSWQWARGLLQKNNKIVY